MIPIEEQHTLPFPTDTATPQTLIPIFYLHEGEHPFCLQPRCICHVNEARLKELLQGVLDRTLKLREVQNNVVKWEGGK
jgi:hypothetical protein